jgi:hypothetical protein
MMPGAAASQVSIISVTEPRALQRAAGRSRDADALALLSAYTSAATVNLVSVGAAASTVPRADAPSSVARHRR